ncbi:MAG: L-serine ammonia-lyase, iron-sulfur-dependent subunit beta [Andreesenia angusta]|nr:L-serine ammonia-lyase, iron-sulfur-dependent subunit beta [Andreesenia angusta]
MADKQYGIFDVLGPIMIGPSSSHTAGAARLGKVGKEIVGKDFDEVKFYLHGSFAKTYRGHGTDRALVAGVLGMDPGDERLREALDMAKEQDLKIEFEEANLGHYQHPNTVKMEFHCIDGTEFSVTGSSIGGGSIVIKNIEGTNVSFMGNKPVIMVYFDNKDDIESEVEKIVQYSGAEIETFETERTETKDESAFIIETKDEIVDEAIEKLMRIETVKEVKKIRAV